MASPDETVIEPDDEEALALAALREAALKEGLIEITPYESSVPVFLNPAPVVADEGPQQPSPDEVIAANEKLRASAINKLMHAKPLTENEARLITGA